MQSEIHIYDRKLFNLISLQSKIHQKILKIELLTELQITVIFKPTLQKADTFLFAQTEDDKTFESGLLSPSKPTKGKT